MLPGMMRCLAIAIRPLDHVPNPKSLDLKATFFLFKPMTLGICCSKGELTNIGSCARLPREGVPEFQRTAEEIMWSVSMFGGSV